MNFCEKNIRVKILTDNKTTRDGNRYFLPMQYQANGTLRTYQNQHVFPGCDILVQQQQMLPL